MRFYLLPLLTLVQFLLFPVQTFSNASPTAPSPLNPLEVYDVVDAMKPREIKRILTSKYQYTSKQIYSLWEKEDLVNALVKEARNHERTKPPDPKEHFEFLLKNYFTSAVAAIMIYFMFQNFSGFAMHRFQLEEYIRAKKNHIDNCLLAGAGAGGWKGYIAVVLICAILLLDFVVIWMKFTTIGGWICPYNWYNVRRLFFPYIPNLSVSPDMLMGGGKSSGGGGGGGINMGSMLMTMAIGWVTTKIEVFVVYLVENNLRSYKIAKAARKESRKAAREAKNIDPTRETSARRQELQKKKLQEKKREESDDDEDEDEVSYFDQLD
ncbi:hypothetical protein ScalyP_jg7988 [Parmales sp. scaly parma]|nr:hypothetical protein ScalyP_jg7988 [Parmales sp. scaly parma]